MDKITLSAINKLKAESKKFSVLTAYDSTFAQIISEAGVEILLVGDSLGMVVQGRDSTVPVTMNDMIYHTRAVAKGNRGSLIMADMPFMSYATEEDTLTNAAQLMQAGAHIVKLEGGDWLNKTVSRLTQSGIPVCAHIGLTPQSVNKLGGYRVQGRDQQDAQNLVEDALALERAGADILLMECIPGALATQITQQLSIPTIGIGAGSGTDAQVLVLHDMLGIATDYSPRFVKNFLVETGNIQEAIAAYDRAVKTGTFPGPEHCY